VLTGPKSTARRNRGHDRYARRKSQWKREQEDEYVLAANEAGSKLEKAKQLGIPILDEAKFRKMAWVVRAPRDHGVRWTMESSLSGMPDS